MFAGDASAAGACVRQPLRLVAYTDSTHRGGAEISLGNLLAALGPHVDATVMGVDSDIVTWVASRRPGTGTMVVPPVREKRDVRAMWAHRRTLAVLRPDVFHANLTSLWSCQYALLAALSVRGVSVIAVEQLPLVGDSRLSVALKRFTSSRLAAHVAVGDEAARLVERAARLRAGSVRTIHNGVPDVPVTPAPRASPGPVVGSAARFDRVKGLDVLVNALARIPGATLVLVGEGPERGRLEAQAASLGLTPCFRVVDWTDRPRDHIASFDVFALPSRLEGFPLTIVEAMLAGVAVVATGVGSTAEAVVDGETGLLVPPDDVDALAGALRRLLDDAELRAAMGRRGRERALEQFTAETMARAFENLYDEVLTARGDRHDDG